MNGIGTGWTFSLAMLGLLVVALYGCGEPITFECETHEHCLSGEACIEEICVDAPVAGDQCPESHEGDQVQDLTCVGGEWTDAPPAPVVERVSADPPSVDPAGSVALEVIVDSLDVDGLEYAWSAPEGWEFVDDDAPQVELIAINEPGQTATIEVVVTDSYGGSDRGEVSISTHEIDGPQIESIDVTPQQAIPGGIQEVTVVAHHPLEQELEYLWELPQDWEAQGDLSGPVIEVRAPQEHEATGTLEVTVVDAFSKEISTTVDLSTEALFCGGEGTVDAPWDICSARFVNRVGVYEDYLEDHFLLSADVDMEDLDEDSFHVIGDRDRPFLGVFDGGEHSIANLKIDSENDEVGLFGRIGGGGEVRNLTLDNVDVDGEDQVGALAGRNEGTLRDVRVSGRVSGLDEVGGLVGRNQGTIARTAADVEVFGDQGDTGGLVGLNTGTVDRSVARGDVESDGESVGGLVGRNWSTISDSYAGGDVEGDGTVGGLVGNNGSDGTIERVYSTGTVTGSFGVGGLVGENSGTVSESLWDVESSGVDGSAAGTGWESTVEFRRMHNFPEGWSFYPDDDFVWVMRKDSAGDLRPSLGWEEPCASSCGTGICDETLDICVHCNVHSDTPSEFGGGAGTVDDPWRMCSVDHLQWVAELGDEQSDYLDDSFALFDDIELDIELDQSFWDGEFGGIFDGHGHWLDGVTIEVDDGVSDRVGFFSHLGSEAEVRNLTLKGVRIEAPSADEVGGLAGRNQGTIVGCHLPAGWVEGGKETGVMVGRNTGAIIDSSVPEWGFAMTRELDTAIGGLVGYHGFGATIDGAFVEAMVMVDEGDAVGGAGGLVGISHGSISNSHTFVDMDVWAETDTGGLVGILESGGQVKQSFAEGWSSTRGGNVGGLIGRSKGTVADCFSTAGAVNHKSSDFPGGVGGLIGRADGNSVTRRCYATGEANWYFLDDTGYGDPEEVLGTWDPLVGENGIGATFEFLYWDKETSNADDSTTGEGLMTDEFDDEENFISWDFNDVWTIGDAPDLEDEVRPIFQWQVED